MSRFLRRRLHRVACLLIAAVMASGLLHSPSMVLAGAAALVGCDSAGENHHSAPATHDHRSRPSDDSATKMTPSCPLANVAAIGVTPPAMLCRDGGSRLVLPAAPVPHSIDLVCLDPPPRGIA